jgi:hypothetical protein
MIRERVPNYALADFLAAFRYSPDAEALFRQGASLKPLSGQITPTLTAIPWP